METLKKLAVDQFGELTAAENKLLESVSNGTLAQCSGPTEADNDPGKMAEWTNDRTIRSSILRWLCTNKDVLPLIDSSGLAITGARFVGELNLAGVDVRFSLRLLKCGIPDGISLHDASFRNVDLSGTVCSFLQAWRLNLSGSLFLRSGFRANGPVMLAGASINRDLECVDAQLISSAAIEKRFGLAPNLVLMLDRAHIGGRIVLDRMKATGVVHLVSATINGFVDCLGAEISIGINLRDAQSRSMNFSGTKCPYFIADRVETKGSLFLRNGFCSEGTVVLLNSSISGDLDCSGSSFGSAKLNTDLRKKAEESFGYNLPNLPLALNSSSIGGYVFLSNGFEANGEVAMNGVSIGANLVCLGGRFFSAGNDALTCHFSHVKGAALFRNASNQGPKFQTNKVLNFFGTKIEGSISFTGAEFLDGPSGVRLRSTVIGGAVQWKEVTLTSDTTLNLSHTRAGQLEDDQASWPAPGNLILDGFTYDAILGVPLNSRERKLWLKSRLDYLRRQARTEFSLQPHRRLAEILRQSGYEDNARSVLVDMQKARREQGGFSRVGWLWSWVLQATIGFGYRSHRAFAWSLFFVVAGAFLFRAGYHTGYLVPVKAESAHLTQFSSIAYSLDTFLPIINLRHEEFWIPTGHGSGRWLQVYYWIHICLGWALITLGVAGFTGLIRKD